MRAITIAGKRIGDDTDAYVVAEAGNNHAGSVQTAMALIKIAADCGANAVKFQTRSNRDLYTRAMYGAPYHSEAAFGPTYGAHREALELPHAAYPDLMAYAASLGLAFMSTPFDFKSADFLARLGVPAFKIASGDLRSIPLIKHVAEFGKPIIVSTGGGTLADVRRVYDALYEMTTWETTEASMFIDGKKQPRRGRGSRADQLALLQCTAAYPVAAEEMNLRAIETFRREFPDTVIGLSDHYSGVLPGPLAYLLGARIYEKHVTFSRAARGTDHAFSLEPAGFTTFVNYLRAAPLMLGDGCKRPYESEAPGLMKMSKSLVAARDLPAGHVLRESDLAMKSPGGGLPPYRLGELVGRTLRTALAADEAVMEAGVGL